MKAIAFFLFTFIAITSFAQDNYEANVQDDTTAVYKYDTHKVSFFLNGGSFLSNNDIHIKKAQPFSIDVGVEYNYRPSAYFGLATLFGWNNNSFTIIQDPSIGFPTTSVYDKNTIEAGGLFIGFGPKLFIPAKQNYRYKFSLTVYGFGEYELLRNLVVYKKLDNSNNPYASSEETTFKKLDYLNSFHYGIGGEIKIYYIFIGGKYYLTDFIKASYIKEKNWPQLPKLKLYVKYMFE